MNEHLELEKLRKFFTENKDKILQEYMTFLKFQSISSEPPFKEQVLACANWVVDYLKNIGFSVELWPTSGHPVIYANYHEAGPQKPTLLIYNHYDVQPVDPLELWDSPPFEPTLKEGKIYARGAQDNKGQCFYVLLALKVLMELYGELPVNVKLCIEGEEECASSGLADILADRRTELKANYLAIVDLGLRRPDLPAITLGLRGIITMDVEVTGSTTDLHSGSHGGLAFNPIHALVRLLATLRDSSGRVNVPGFYEDIAPLTKSEKAEISLDFDPKEYEKTFGAKPTGGEREYQPLERNWLRPSLEINGIRGGYSGDGFKTVIAAKAFAKISCRLVPNQIPEKVGKLVAQFIESHAPEGTKAKVDLHKGSGRALHASVNSKIVKAFSHAYQEIFKVPCEFIYSGASIPIVTELAAACGGEIVLVGLGLPTDCIHAPNEHFSFDRIEKGFLSIARALQLLV